MADKKKLEKQAKRAARESRDPTLPATRAELMELHRQTRAQRNAAPWGSKEHVAAITLISRIEIEIARIERAMDPPLG